MKLGDIEISEDGVVIALFGIFFFFGICVLMVIISIIKAIALHFFDHVITIGGIPL